MRTFVDCLKCLRTPVYRYLLHDFQENDMRVPEHSVNEVVNKGNITKNDHGEPKSRKSNQRGQAPIEPSRKRSPS